MQATTPLPNPSIPLVSPFDLTNQVANGMKKVQKRVSKACLPCQRGHLSCDEARPCKRCVERGKECVAGETKRRGRKKRSPEASLTSEEIAAFLPSIDEMNGTLVLGSHVPVYNEEDRLHVSGDFTVGSDVLLSSGSSSSPLLGSGGSPNSFSDSMEDLIGSMSVDLPSEDIGFIQQLLFGTHDPPVKKFRAPDVPVPNDDAPITAEELDQTDNIIPIIHAKQLKYFSENVLKVRCPDVYDILTSFDAKKAVFFGEWRDKVFEAAPRLYAQLENYLSQMHYYDHLGCPVLIWEKNFRIRYVNQAYRRLTGYHGILPTRFSECAFAEHISTDTLRQHVVSNLLAFKYSDDDSSYTIPAAFKKHDGAGYIDGTLAVTMQRGEWKVPLLFIGTFLPYKTTPFPTPSLVNWDEVLHELQTKMWQPPMNNQ
eukprot:TRINITY_DN5061_c0_g1_i1.p1 TRINITY_DN5061_c0_g1~~TRINITY_DN5061_c0_g1_i1.p1  ORF type:complete len:426 (+),score=58.15 TRINITY_DN5061_c0_g1_i1:34-1311(+)